MKIRSVSKNFGGLKALNNCTLSLEKGKITALIGPNGSGKTTLFNVICKLVAPEKGSILIKQADITKLKTHQISKLGISRTFQETRLFKNLTIKDHIEIALSEDDESIIKSLFIKEKDKRKKVKDILSLVGLDKPLKTLGNNLSYGQRKLLDLAIAMANPHSVLLLDEPVAGVNPQLRKKIKSIIEILNKKGETVLIIEHDMNFIMDLAHKVFVLDEGKIIAEGTPKQIQRNKKVLDAYLGE